jgi:predicted dithiol-disulfide oxidoreductase (DUF899 family)
MPDRTPLAPQHAVRFPNESAAYRAARSELLEAELALRRQLEAVAALRRRLPLGGEVHEDYAFEEGARDLDNDSGARQRVRRARRQGVPLLQRRAAVCPG